MNIVNLGTTGLRVSELCFGAMTFGQCDEPLSHRLLDRFVERGGNFIDTADIYGRGVSENFLGSWLAQKNRDDFVIATKLRWPMAEAANDVGLGRKHMLKAIDASLTRLRTDHVDIYQLHCWDPVTPLEESLSTLDRIVQDGKARFVGVSNFCGWQLQKAIDLARARGWEPLVCLQPLYNLLDRATEWELLPICQNEGLGVIPWSPLRGGWLSGKFKRGMTAPPEDSRVAQVESRGGSERWSNYNKEHTWRVLDELHAVAAECGKHPAQVALNWLLCQRSVTAPILGARSLEQLDTNLGAIGWRLDPALLERLQSVSEIPRPYPWS